MLPRSSRRFIRRAEEDCSTRDDGTDGMVRSNAVNVVAKEIDEAIGQDIVAAAIRDNPRYVVIISTDFNMLWI